MRHLRRGGTLRSTTRLCIAAALLVAALGLVPAALADAPSFNNVKVMGKVGGGSPWTEPRIATDPSGRIWVVTNDDKNGTAVVLSSSDGGRTFTQTPTPPPGQTSPSPDT